MENLLSFVSYFQCGEQSRDYLVQLLDNHLVVRQECLREQGHPFDDMSHIGVSQKQLKDLYFEQILQSVCFSTEQRL